MFGIVSQYSRVFMSVLSVRSCGGMFLNRAACELVCRSVAHGYSVSTRHILVCYFIACLTMDYSNSALCAFASVSLCVCVHLCLCVFCICVCRLAAYYRNWLWWWYWCSRHRWVGGAKAMPTLAFLCILCIRVPQKREATNSRPSLPLEVTAVVLETIHW